jgi:hypothetical protein
MLIAAYESELHRAKALHHMIQSAVSLFNERRESQGLRGKKQSQAFYSGNAGGRAHPRPFPNGAFGAKSYAASGARRRFWNYTKTKIIGI